MSIEITDQFVERVAEAWLEKNKREPGCAAVPREWLTPPEAGDYLRLTPKALEHLRADGSGPVFHRYSGRIRYRLEDLRSWANGGREMRS